MTSDTPIPAMPPQQGSLKYQMCTKTVMDTTDPDITFDENGICNYWHGYRAYEATLPDTKTRDELFVKTVSEIKAAGEGNEYDCVLGLSGGVDSSYLAYLAHKIGLRPLVVHFDNGWNSELAVSNIEQLVTRLGYDLETFVMDWEEFKDVQRAYFKASVLDLEVPTDHMIFGALYKIMSKKNIKYLLSGHNYATEWLLPKAWYYAKFDSKNLKNIHKRYGSKPLKKLPALGVWEYSFYYHVKKIRQVNLLDLVDYHKPKAKQFLIDEMGWRDYGGKHHESIFTRFYQGYILPRKFDIDKRKAHASNLILSGQTTREEALAELQKPTYDEDLQKEDFLYVAKKLGFSPKEFETVLSQPNRDHSEFGSDRKERDLYFKIARSWGRVRKFVKRK